MRRMEGADQVLAARVVDADLAADGAVDLGDDRRRHLHDAQAAQERGRGEAGEIADHAAADDHDDGLAVDAGVEQRVVDAGDGAQVLGALAVGDQDDRHPRQARLDARPDGGPDPRTRHHDRAIRPGQAGQRAAQAGGEAAADANGVGRPARAGADGDGEGAHRNSS